MANETSERTLLSEQADSRAQANGSTQHSNGNAPSYYQALGVDENAHADQLAEAYARLRERHHPERNSGDPLARDIVRYLDRAYATLIDPELRRTYDASLANGDSSNGH